MGIENKNLNILFFNQLSYDVSELIEFIHANQSFALTIRDTEASPQASQALPHDHWSLVILCGKSSEQITPLLQKKFYQSLDIPIIVLLENPTVDQVVDLMFQGACGVADFRHTERIMELIQRELDYHNSSATDVYKNIVQNQTELICRYNKDFELLFANKAYVEWLGIPANELIGTSILDRIPPDYHQNIFAYINSLDAENPISISVHPSTLPDGSSATIEWTDRAIFDNAGEIVEYIGVGRDVTTRELQAEQLELYQNNLTAVLNTMQDSVTSLSLPDNELIFVSASFETVFGYSLETFVENPRFWEQIVPSDDLIKSQQTMQQCLREGYAELQHRVIWPDGQVRWIQRRAWVIYDENGQPKQLNDSGRDITEQKLAEESLKQSEELYRITLSNISDAVFITDDAGKLTFVCPNANRVFGYSDEEFSQFENIQTLLGEQPFDSTQLRQLGEIANIEQQVIDKNGATHDLLISVKDVEIQGGTVLYACRDVTERKQAQNELQFHAEVLNTMSEGVHVVRATDLSFVYVNESLAEMFGYQREELIGKSIEILYETSLEALNHTTDIAASLASTGTWTGELHNTRKDGSHFWSQATIVAYDHADYGKVWINVQQDITETKANQDALRASKARLQAIINSQTNYVIRTNLEGYHVYVNPKSQNEYGYIYQGRDITEQYALDAICDYHHQRARDAVAKCIADPNTVVQVELDKPDKNGEIHATLWDFICLTDSNNLPFEIQCIGIDISDRVAAQKKLIESERRYRQMFEHIGLPKLIFDLEDGRIIDANPSAVLFYGYPSTVIKTLHMTDIYQASPDEIKTEINKVVRGEVASSKFTQKLADGSLREVESFSAEIVINGKDVYYSVYVDVTDRNKAQRELAESNALLERRVQARTDELKRARDQLEAIFNHSGDGVVLLNIESGIRQANITFNAMFGTNNNAYIGTDFSSFFKADTVDLINDTIKSVATTHHAQTIEAIATHIDQSTFYTEINIVPVNHSDKAVKDLVCIIRDITDRKTAEDARQNYTEIITDLYNNAPIGYHALDATGVFISINDTALNWFKYSRNEIVDKVNFIDLLTPASRVHFSHTFPQLHEVGHIEDIEFEIQCKDGNTIWVLGSASAVYDQTGKFIRTRTTLSNITELKKAQQAVAEERNLLRTLIDTIPDYIYVKDLQHRIIIDNAAHAQSVGHDNPADVIGKTDTELVSVEMAAKFMADDKQLFADQTPLFNVEEYVPDIDGSKIWALTTKVPFYALDGSLQGLVGITKNISDMKEAEHALRESENMLQLVLDTIPVRVFWKDKESRYLGCNRLFAEDAGLNSNHDIVGKSDMEMPWRGELAETFRIDDFHVINSRKAKLDYEEPLKTADDEQILVRTSKIPLLNSENQTIGMLGSYIDITEQKQAEEQLRYLASLQEFMSDSVISTDMTFHIQTWNKASVKMFGWDAQEVIGQNLIELLKMDFIHDGFDAASQKLMTNGYWAGEVILYHRDGTPIHVLGSIGFNRDENGIPVGIIGVNHDITERKKAENELRESEERFRHLANSVSDIITRATPDLIHNYESASIFNILGYYPEELIGESVFDYIHLDDVEQLFNAIRIARQTPGTHKALFRHRHKDGHYLWMESTFQFTFDSDTNEPMELIATTRDVTDRMESEQRLQLLSQRLRLATQAGGIGIWDWNIEADSLYWDDRMHQIYAVPSGIVMDTPSKWEQYLHPDDIQSVQSAIETSLQNNTPFNEVFRIVLPNKQERYILAHALIVRKRDDTPERMVGVNMDVTEVKMAQVALQDALTKEKELNELKSRFVSMASHQFRTPLTVILSTIESLMIYRDRMDNKQIEDRLNRIRKQVFYLKRVMEDVLELARIQADQIPFQPAKSDIKEFCLSLIDDLQQNEDYINRIQFESTENPIIMHFDSHLMHHLMSNLIHNALKYSPEHTNITVKLVENDEIVIFEVSDHGIGIPEKDIPHLFEPFHRAENVVKITGTGLGLSISKQAVDAHGGTIKVESIENTGTTFIVSLPK